MRIITDKQFDKSYSKLPQKIKIKFSERRDLFIENEFYPLLDNHPLMGKYHGFRSINITGDFRAVYYKHSRDLAVFVNIGTHSQLYG